MEQKAWIIDEKTAKQYLTVEDAIDCVEKTWKWYGEVDYFVRIGNNKQGYNGAKG